MRILYIVMILSLNGCGVNDTGMVVVNQKQVAPIVSNYGIYGSYVKEFKDLVGAATGTRPSDKVTSIAYVDASEKGTWATCFITYDDEAQTVIYSAHVELDPNLKGQSDILLRAVLLHELGHCIMNSHHVEDSADLMYPYTSKWISEDKLDSRVARYMERLAEGKNS